MVGLFSALGGNVQAAMAGWRGRLSRSGAMVGAAGNWGWAFARLARATNSLFVPDVGATATVPGIVCAWLLLGPAVRWTRTRLVDAEPAKPEQMTAP